LGRRRLRMGFLWRLARGRRHDVVVVVVVMLVLLVLVLLVLVLLVLVLLVLVLLVLMLMLMLLFVRWWNEGLGSGKDVWLPWFPLASPSSVAWNPLT